MSDFLQLVISGTAVGAIYALADAGVQERIRALGIEPAVAMSADESLKWIAIEHDKWARLIREKNINVE